MTQNLAIGTPPAKPSGLRPAQGETLYREGCNIDSIGDAKWISTDRRAGQPSTRNQKYGVGSVNKDKVDLMKIGNREKKPPEESRV